MEEALNLDMKKPNGPLARKLLSVIAVFFALTFSITPAHAQVKPGDTITPKNAQQVRTLVSPGTYFAVTKGMGMEIVAPKPVEWPPPYKIATEQYSSQVRLSAGPSHLLGYVAGQPFPLLDTNDPYVATKIMWDPNFVPSRPTTPTCDSSNARSRQQNPGGAQKLMNQTETRALAATTKSDAPKLSRCRPIPDFKKTDIWWRAGAYPVISPAEGRGSGGIRYRYWDPNRGDDAWAFLRPRARAPRQRNDPEFVAGTDHLGSRSRWRICRQAAGVQLQIPRRAKHARVRAREEFARASVPDRRQSTACNEDWEMRHLYVIEVTPRPDKTSGHSAVEDHRLHRRRGVVQSVRR